MTAAALPIAPPVTFDAVSYRGSWRGEIIDQDKKVVSRMPHTYSTRQKALAAVDLLWRSIRAQAAEVDL